MTLRDYLFFDCKPLKFTVDISDVRRYDFNKIRQKAKKPNFIKIIIMKIRNA